MAGIGVLVTIVLDSVDFGVFITPLTSPFESRAGVAFVLSPEDEATGVLEDKVVALLLSTKGDEEITETEAAEDAVTLSTALSFVLLLTRIGSVESVELWCPKPVTLLLLLIALTEVLFFEISVFEILLAPSQLLITVIPFVGVFVISAFGVLLLISVVEVFLIAPPFTGVL